MSLTMDRIDFLGWKDCLRLSNGIIELVATTQVGPRIISFGFVGGPNEFQIFDEHAGLSGGDEWRIYGGHRLWHSPEMAVRSYAPDNGPVEVAQEDGGVRLCQPIEPTTGIGKEIELKMHPRLPRVSVLHRLTNNNLWGIDLAPWALSVMAAGGTGIVPLPCGRVDDEGFLPNRSISVWPYADMSDQRVQWGRDYILLRQEASAHGPFKFGVNADAGWCAYANHGHLFVKLFDHLPGAVYPDFEASVECYTSERMLELETVGPLVYLEPGCSVTHPEEWLLLTDIAMPQNEENVREDVQPQIDRVVGV